MAVESVNQLPTDESAAGAPLAVDAVQPVTTEQGGSEAGHQDLPKGALAFGLVVLAVFALYWLVTYLEIVIGRQ